MNDDIKENKCSVLFFCCHSLAEPCQFKSGKDIICDYKNTKYECESKVANMNAMLLKLNESGFTFDKIKFNQDG